MSKSRNETSIKKIQVSKNGPYVFVGRVPMTEQTIVCEPDGTSIEWRAGKEYPMQEKCIICRCGHSKNKPFCDGTHVKIGFDGTETAAPETYLDHPKKLDGPTLRLIDIEELCASARFCHRAGGIWNLVPKSNVAEIKKTIIEEACDCPSGRLTVYDRKAQQVIQPKLKKTIGFIEDPWIGGRGPIWVRGRIAIESAEGKTYRIRNMVTLCRCGKSLNKPFCDSSHYPEAGTVEKVHDE